MRRFRVLVVAALLLPMGWLSASPAQAQGGAVCSFAANFRVLPGWSQAPSKGTLSTGGETGSVDCVGVILGQEVLGVGTFGFTGEYGTGPAGGDTCSDGEGRGLYTMHIPTSLGVIHVQGSFSEDFVGNAGQFFGSGPAELICLFQFRPTEGDCVTTPARAETLTGQGSVVA
jgi:hypothetical protein